MAAFKSLFADPGGDPEGSWGWGTRGSRETGRCLPRHRGAAHCFNPGPHPDTAGSHASATSTHTHLQTGSWELRGWPGSQPTSSAGPPGHVTGPRVPCLPPGPSAGTSATPSCAGPCSTSLPPTPSTKPDAAGLDGSQATQRCWLWSLCPLRLPALSAGHQGPMRQAQVSLRPGTVRQASTPLHRPTGQAGTGPTAARPPPPTPAGRSPQADPAPAGWGGLPLIVARGLGKNSSLLCCLSVTICFHSV